MPVDMDTIDAMMEETEEYYDDIAEIADKNFKHADFKLYPRNVTGDYKRDADMADRLYAKCLDAYDALRNADEITKSRVTRLQKAHDAFHLATQALDESNNMFEAFLDEGVATKAAALMEALSLLVKAHQKRVDDMEEELEELAKLIKKAKKEVTQAEIQKGLNTALTVVGLCLPAVAGARGLLAGLAIAGGKLSMDELLGPTGPTKAGAVKTAATEYGSIADEMGNIGGKIIGIVSGVDTWIADTKEVESARKSLRTLKKKLDLTQKAAAALERLLDGSDKDLIRLAIGFEKAVAGAHAARGRFTEHELTRHDLLAEMEAG